MIITFTRDPINSKAVDALTSKDAQQVFDYYDMPERIVFDTETADSTLILLDLSANGSIQNLLAPSIIAERLHELRFLSRINTIKLLIADIVPSKPISVFAWELSQSILEILPDSSIEIRLAIDLEENPSLIEPPADKYQTDWIIYSLSNPINVSPSNKRKCFEFYRSNTSNVLFKGKIDDKFSEEIKIDPEVVRKTYGTH